MRHAVEMNSAPARIGEKRGSATDPLSQPQPGPMAALVALGGEFTLLREFRCELFRLGINFIMPWPHFGHVPFDSTTVSPVGHRKKTVF